MEQALSLLQIPEKRPVKEAIVWYKDGFKLVKKQPGAWASYMVTAILLLLAVIFAIDIVIAFIIQQIPAFSSIGLMIFIVTSAWIILSLQTGMYRSMSRVAVGGQVKVEDLFWGFGQLKNQQFWFFIFFISLLNLGFQSLEGQLVGEIYHFDANNASQIVLNEEKIGLFLGLNSAYWLLLSILTWAVLPIMTEFSNQKFWLTLKRNLYGTIHNALALVYLVALIMLTFFVLSAIIIIMSSILHPVLAVAFFFLIIFWGIPLFNSWQYSAYRHIFTDW